MEKTFEEEIELRGLRPVSPGQLDESLQLALQSMSAVLYGETTQELTVAEQEVLRRGGLELEEKAGPDPLADTAAKFAALIKTSLSTSEVSKRLGFGAGRIRQMVADRTLYSFLLDGRRYVPIFQFTKGARRLLPNITRVNPVLSPDLHPVEVYDWYVSLNPDLVVDDETERTASPLDWLKAGNDPEPVVRLAKEL